MQSQASICNGRGMWEPPIGSCQAIHCIPPPSLPGMNFIGNAFQVNNTVTYRCVGFCSMTILYIDEIVE